MNSRAAIAAIVAFILLAIGCAILTVRMTARALDETASAQAAEAPEIARLYLAKFGTLGAAAPTIVQRVSRSGLRVVLVDFSSGIWYDAHGGVHRPPHPPEMPANADPAGPPPGGSPPATGGVPPGGPLGPELGPDARGGPWFTRRPGGLERPDWTALVVGAIASSTTHHVRIPGGALTIFPEVEPLLRVLRTVAIALAGVLICSMTILWFYVRGVRRAALRPLTETTLALQRLAQRDFAPRTILTGEGSAYDDLARAYNAAVEAVAAAFAERRAAEAEMQRFIADAGHELRTPLTIVMGYLDVIDGGALADPRLAGRITGGMRTETMRMRRLVEKLMVLARMETPSDVEARTDIDVVALIGRVIESLEALTNQPIEVRGVPFAHVFASEDDIAEALFNILENAIKYAPASPIEIAVTRTAERVIVTIGDHGPGMTSEEQRNAFERFYRGDQRGEVSGSGLGLAIAKRAIDRSRGTIRLTSAPGHGTTFTIELPEMPISAAGPPAGFVRS